MADCSWITRHFIKLNWIHRMSFGAILPLNWCGQNPGKRYLMIQMLLFMNGFPVVSSIPATTRWEVAVFANVLQKNGVAKGDRVIVYMPMIPEAVISMLACARIGAIHSVVFGGFAAKELATRVIDASPKLVISASCGIEGKKVIPYLPLLDEALELAGAENLTRILVSRPQLPIEEPQQTTRFIFSTPPAPRGSPRGSCVPTGVMLLHSTGP